MALIAVTTWSDKHWIDPSFVMHLYPNSPHSQNRTVVCFKDGSQMNCDVAIDKLASLINEELRKS